MTNIEAKLEQYKISRLQVQELKNHDHTFIHDYFMNYILPILSPQVVGSHHPFPHLTNKALFIAVMFHNEEGKRFGFIPVPQSIPRIVFLPGNTVRFVLTEDIILEHTEQVFDLLEIEDKTIISVTRNADLSPADEDYHDDLDYRHLMIKILKKRKRLAPVRLEIQTQISEQLLHYLCEHLNLKHEQVYIGMAPLIMSYVFDLQNKLIPTVAKALSYPKFIPQPSVNVSREESMIQQIMKRDLLLHYPYEQMEPFLRLIKEAAYNEQVISIKITIYRLANNSKLIEYLTAAAENHKEVTVLMELRARFDEENNINWAEILEEAGCTIIYGIENYKVHSKICLITRWNDSKVQYITQIGTGNYNEKTAKIYTDLCLLTANNDIGLDAASFFKNISTSNLEGTYSHLLVAPTTLKPSIIALIDREITKAKTKKKGKILMKINSFTDRTIITKLSEASCAGVKIHLIIHGICCIVPGIKNKTENISVISVIGRFLEHPRIYSFGEGDDQLIYISSADMMTRNTEKRVEIACPIYDQDVKNKINEILDITLRDNVKVRILQSDKQYTRPKIVDSQPHIDSQAYFMNEAIENVKQLKEKTSVHQAVQIKEGPTSFIQKLWYKLKRNVKEIEEKEKQKQV